MTQSTRRRQPRASRHEKNLNVQRGRGAYPISAERHKNKQEQVWRPDTGDTEALFNSMVKQTVRPGSNHGAPNGGGYQQALKDMRRDLAQALHQVEGELRADEAEQDTPASTHRPVPAQNRTPALASLGGNQARSRPQSAVSAALSTRRGESWEQLLATKQSRPFSAYASTQRSRRNGKASQRSKDPYLPIANSALSDFDSRFDAALQPAKKLMSKRKNQSLTVRR